MYARRRLYDPERPSNAAMRVILLLADSLHVVE